MNAVSELSRLVQNHSLVTSAPQTKAPMKSARAVQSQLSCVSLVHALHELRRQCFLFLTKSLPFLNKPLKRGPKEKHLEDAATRLDQAVQSQVSCVSLVHALHELRSQCFLFLKKTAFLCEKSL